MNNTHANNDENRYFKIGAFVLVGIGLIIFALLVFGSSKLLEPIVYVETYFEESIQGISDGTPVKYRGLQIGYVKEIAFTTEIYHNHENLSKKMHARSIYVKIAITSKLFTELTEEELEQFLSKEINNGLRVRLITQGLTGTSFLGFDYVDPRINPIPQLAWKPKYFYVPSVTSTLTRLSENTQYILNELKDIDFKKIFSDLNTLTLTMDRVTGKTENLLDQIDYPLDRIIQNLNIISDNLLMVTNRVKLKPSEVIFSSYPPPLDPGKL